jgi:cell division protein FtsB
LRRDPAAIERLAREELGLARSGETIFIIREEVSADHR